MSIPLDDPPGGDAHALRLEATRMAGLHDDLDAMARVLRGLDGAGWSSPSAEALAGRLEGIALFLEGVRDRLGGTPGPLRAFARALDDVKEAEKRVADRWQRAVDAKNEIESAGQRPGESIEDWQRRVEDADLAVGRVNEEQVCCQDDLLAAERRFVDQMSELSAAGEPDPEGYHASQVFDAGVERVTGWLESVPVIGSGVSSAASAAKGVTWTYRRVFEGEADLPSTEEIAWAGVGLVGAGSLRLLKKVAGADAVARGKAVNKDTRLFDTEKDVDIVHRGRRVTVPAKVANKVRKTPELELVAAYREDFAIAAGATPGARRTVARGIATVHVGTTAAETANARIESTQDRLARLRGTETAQARTVRERDDRVARRDLVGKEQPLPATARRQVDRVPEHRP